MDKEKFRCYACNWKLTKNGTDLRKDPDVRVQRNICRNKECGVWNIFIIIESENQSFNGMYFFPKIKDRVFTFEEAVERYKAREKLLTSSDAEEMIDLFDGDNMGEFIADSYQIKEEIRQVKKLEYRKKDVEAALERNLKKVAKLKEEIEEIEIEINDIKHYKKIIRTQEEAELYAKTMNHLGGKRLKPS